MILTKLYLVMVLCMNEDCTQKSAYVVDSYEGELFDVLADCRPKRNEGNAYYKSKGKTDVELHCWDQSELSKMGFVAEKDMP